MARPLSAGLQTAVAAETSTVVYLIEVNSSSGTTYLATTPTDVSWDSKTWSGVGGHLVWDGVRETPDRRAQGVRLELSGVDRSILAEVLAYHMAGRTGKIYLGHVNSSGAIVTDPYEIFRGYWNDDWTIVEEREGGQTEPGTVRIETRMVSRMAILERSNPVKANVHSHREMIRRAGGDSGVTGDIFFVFLPKLLGKPIYWGMAAPRYTGGGGSGGGQPEEGEPMDAFTL